MNVCGYAASQEIDSYRACGFAVSGRFALSSELLFSHSMPLGIWEFFTLLGQRVFLGITEDHGISGYDSSRLLGIKSLTRFCQLHVAFLRVFEFHSRVFGCQLVSQLGGEIYLLPQPVLCQREQSKLEHSSSISHLSSQSLLRLPFCSFLQAPIIQHQKHHLSYQPPKPKSKPKPKLPTITILPSPDSTHLAHSP